MDIPKVNTTTKKAKWANAVGEVVTGVSNITAGGATVERGSSSTIIRQLPSSKTDYILNHAVQWNVSSSWHPNDIVQTESGSIFQNIKDVPELWLSEFIRLNPTFNTEENQRYKRTPGTNYNPGEDNEVYWKMYRLGKEIVIRLCDDTSPTGYRRYRILAEELSGSV